MARYCLKSALSEVSRRACGEQYSIESSSWETILLEVTRCAKFETVGHIVLAAHIARNTDQVID